HSVTPHDRVIPGLAAERLESPQLPVGRRIGGEQDQFAALRRYQEQLLVGQQHYLTAPITALFPSTFPIRHSETTENTDIKSIRVPVLNNEIREFRLKLFRIPFGGDGPLISIFGDLNQRTAQPAQSGYKQLISCN